MRLHGIFSAAVATSLTVISSMAHAGEVWLTMDYVKPLQLDQEAGQIVVGNPGIADVEVRDSKTLLLFGKSPGATNMYIFNPNGDRIDNLVVRVSAVGQNVILQQGPERRSTLSCLTVCEQTLTIGDGTIFSTTSEQINQKFQQSTVGVVNPLQR
ncbi:MAG: pilus assembly protein N-terminal domain-containing protein [Pseudomonadota bacterium]